MYIIYKASFFTWILIQEVHVIKGLTIEGTCVEVGCALQWTYCTLHRTLGMALTITECACMHRRNYVMNWYRAHLSGDGDLHTVNMSCIRTTHTSLAEQVAAITVAVPPIFIEGAYCAKVHLWLRTWINSFSWFLGRRRPYNIVFRFRFCMASCSYIIIV